MLKPGAEGTERRVVQRADGIWRARRMGEEKRNRNMEDLGLAPSTGEVMGGAAYGHGGFAW